MRSSSRSGRSAAEEPPDLVDRLLAGDEVMFATVVQRWQGGLQRVAQAITGNAAAAEDVVQETWASVLRSLETFEGRSSLRTWVHRVCAHVALARARQDEREAVADEPVVEPGRFDEHGHWREPPARWAEETPEALAARREVMECIERSVAMLPLRQRAVVTLRDVQGFTAEDACEILGVSAVHQRVLLHRARSRVRADCERFYREVA